MRGYLLYDIDHTVSSSDRRDHLLGQWHEYHSNSVDDECYPEMVALIRSMVTTGWHSIAFTARPVRYLDLTMPWLARHGLYPSEILMRTDDGWRPSSEMKLKLFTERFPVLPPEPIIVLEDHPGVCEALYKLNVTVLQVHCRRGDYPNRNYTWRPKEYGVPEIQPHVYSPDFQAMGDCRVCGHEREKVWHLYTDAAAKA